MNRWWLERLVSCQLTIPGTWNEFDWKIFDCRDEHVEFSYALYIEWITQDRSLHRSTNIVHYNAYQHAERNVLRAIKLYVVNEIRKMQGKFPKNITGFGMATSIDTSCCFMIGCWAEKFMHTIHDGKTNTSQQNDFLDVMAHNGWYVCVICACLRHIIFYVGKAVAHSHSHMIFCTREISRSSNGNHTLYSAPVWVRKMENVFLCIVCSNLLISGRSGTRRQKYHVVDGLQTYSIKTSTLRHERMWVCQCMRIWIVYTVIEKF